MPRPRATSIRTSLHPVFPDTATTRGINKAQIYAAKGIKSLYYGIGFASWLEGTEVKAAYPARYKRQNYLVLAPSTGTDRDDKDLEVWNG